MKNTIEKAHVVGRVLLRGPALPARFAFDRNAAADLPSVANALKLLTPGVEGKGAARARRRYLARMAFRIAPSGLFSGVGVGELGGKTAVASGGAGEARIGVGRVRIGAAARALLDDEAVREQVTLRRAASVLTDGETLVWLSREAEVERAPVDPLLRAVLDATEAPAAWPSVRGTLADATGNDDPVAIDVLLLQLVDGGLLDGDLAPPLVGPAPLPWLKERLARLDPRPGMAETIERLLEECVAPVAADDPELSARIGRVSELAESLPGAEHRRPLVATLVLSPRRATLAREAIERAAALAPILFRLDHALNGPTRERDRLPLVDEAARELTELQEPGAFSLAALELGTHGPSMAEAAPALAAELPSLPPPSRPATAEMPVALLRLLVEKLAAANGEAVALTSDELETVLPEIDTPESYELVLAPCREPPRAPPGTDWQLGLHGPAGASWGRFAEALGGPLAEAFSELFSLEKRHLGAVSADLAFAPESVSDAAAHPALRPSTIALSSWPEGGEAIAPADLDLVVRADGDIALQHSDGRAIRPSQLTRIRSTTVGDEGVHRLLVGFGLQRAVAPWAFHPGPLELPRMPRITVDSFVVAPASWRIPPSVLTACRDGKGRAAIAAWRDAEAVPARVQIGFEDQLLPLALDEPDAGDELAALAGDDPPRIYEIWPPLDRLPDEDGRRIEAIAAVVVERAAQRSEKTPRVSIEAAAGWRTFKIFGPPHRADRIIAGAVLPAIAEARADQAIDRWFFLRYLDGNRHHLRVRVRGEGDRFLSRLARFLDGSARIESGDYFPERVRYGGTEALATVEHAFESDSDLAGALVALEPELRPPGGDLLARSFDALCRGIGLTLDERRALATRCRGRVADLLRGDGREKDPLAAWFRARQNPLAAALAADAELQEVDAASPPILAHTERIAAMQHKPLAAALPSLLHLAAVRLVGPGAQREAIGYYLWQRALDSLARRR